MHFEERTSAKFESDEKLSTCYKRGWLTMQHLFDFAPLALQLDYDVKKQ